ncbi:MAG: hypothetical protein NC911_05085 [Candidatus Omnitrophica bacterium]|nr:hypothetical protein [Candidatus Omnitrophota bacterium]
MNTTGHTVRGKKTREIMTSVSEYFEPRSEPEVLTDDDCPKKHLYTNAITPYFRAPVFYLGFPTRFVPERHKKELHPIPGVSGGLCRSSRDGKN